MKTPGDFSKTFSNVRWGNGAGNGDWEYAIVDGERFPIGASARTHRGPATLLTSPSPLALAPPPLTSSGIGSITTSVPASTTLFARVRDFRAPSRSSKEIQIDLDNGPGVDYSYNLLQGDANAEARASPGREPGFGFKIVAELAQGPAHQGPTRCTSSRSASPPSPCRPAGSAASPPCVAVAEL